MINQQSAGWKFSAWIAGDELRASLEGLLTSDPRSATVLAGAILDDMLTRVIASRMDGRADAEELAGASQLDYSVKCTSVREMGIVGERMLGELRGLGRIRNEFAHNPAPDLDFDSPDVAGSVERLRGPEQVARDRSIAGVGSGVQEALARSMPLPVDGRRYWWTISVLSVLGVLGARLHVENAGSNTAK